MRYENLTLTIGEFSGVGYPVSAVADTTGRVSAVLPPPTADLRALLGRVAGAAILDGDEALAQQVGEALFGWIATGPVEGHLRVAWDRAERAGHGLRLRLSIDAPEVGAWPWELLHDPERDHTFASSPSTLLVRYFDQAHQFGSLAEQATDIPLDVLLVLPVSAELDLGQERRRIEAVAAGLPGLLRLKVLEGVVTRSDLADALLMGDYRIVHFSGHGAFIDGRGYLSLNRPDGSPDWINSSALARLAVNHNPTKLVVLNACSSGQVDDGRAFQGLAPRIVRFGVPAVVAMQHPIDNASSTAFADAFYKRLCNGLDAGQVDVAVTYARGMLRVLYPQTLAWAAPVLFTHAPDSIIFRLRGAGISRGPDAEPVGADPQLAALQASLRASQAFADDWELAGPDQLREWQTTLRRAEEAYRNHAIHPRPEVQRMAWQGLQLVQLRLAAVARALAAADPAR